MCSYLGWCNSCISREHGGYLKIKRRMGDKKEIDESFTAPASFRQADTNRCTQSAHTWEYRHRSKAHAVVTWQSSVQVHLLCRWNNTSQAATADCAIQTRYLNVTTLVAQRGGVLTRRQKQCADEFNIQQQGRQQTVNVATWGRKTCEWGCLLERRASGAGAEASMCAVNTVEEPDWLLQTRLEWKGVYVCGSLLCV